MEGGSTLRQAYLATGILKEVKKAKTEPGIGGATVGIFVIMVVTRILYLLFNA